MSSFKETLKSNLIATNNKYNLSLEKIGRVLQKSSKQNSYTISILTKDGTKSVFEDVCVKLDASETAVKIEPKIGELVYVVEDKGRYVITGIYKEFESKKIATDFYSNIYNGGCGSYLQ